MLFEAGDDEALAMLRELPPLTQHATLSRNSSTETAVDNRQIAWLDVVGINLKIGNPSLKPKNPAEPACCCRRSPPRTGDGRRRSRPVCSQLLRLLQARSGDFAVASRPPSRSLTSKRADFPGRAADSTTRSSLPRSHSSAGSRRNRRQGGHGPLARAEVLCRAVEAEDEARRSGRRPATGASGRSRRRP